MTSTPRLFALRFDTALGEAALGASDAGLRGVVWPALEGSREPTLEARWPGVDTAAAPSDALADAAGRIRALLAGERVDLSGIRLDRRGVDAFRLAVYDAARTIPPGRLLTYGDLAARLDPAGFGSDLPARAVGRALGANPWPIVVPCHRVVAAGGRLGGFSAPGGTAIKARLLAIEQARFGDAADLFDAA